MHQMASLAGTKKTDFFPHSISFCLSKNKMSYTTKIVGGKRPVQPPVQAQPANTQTENILFMEQDPLSFQYKRIHNLWVPIPIIPGEAEKRSIERMKLCVERSVAQEKTSQDVWDATFHEVNEEISRKYYGVRRANESDQPGEWKAAEEL
jgi:hypothetical protein